MYDGALPPLPPPPPGPLAAVDRVQSHLEAIYGIRCAARAHAFVVDADAAARLGGTGRTDEELLVREDAGELELALYYAPALLARAEGWAVAPHALPARELGPYCTLAEGVSHFLYLAHTAAHERTVSLLELEAQAEVDKFALCLLPHWGQAGLLAWARELLARLFDRVSYGARLSPEERWRYVEANRLARAFCHRLLEHVEAARLDRLLGALRYAYRLGAEAKLQHLATSP